MYREVLVPVDNSTESDLAIDRAIELLSDGNPYLRFVAAELLREWSGEDYGVSQVAWNGWWEEKREGFTFPDRPDR